MSQNPVSATTAPDKGTAYGRPEAKSNEELTRVGAGTPMGELLRRYWHPIGLSADASSTPKKVRVLGEDLILFRDGEGRAGLVYPHCAHRGTSLYYGKVEERGIRCCYHGWLFSVDGHCLEQPCEPEGGKFRDKVRQPWYPVQEQYGLIWTYMGPPEKKPVLPRYECLEVLDEGEFVEADGSSIGGGGPVVIDCNWLQHYENLVDPFHVVILHSAFSGDQFVPEMGAWPEVRFETGEVSVRSHSTRRLDNGKVFYRISEAGLPTLRVIASPRLHQYGRVESLGFILPIDDHSFRIFVAGRVKVAGEMGQMRLRMNGKLWSEMSEAEHQRYPSDCEAMVSQGAIPRHSEEHLATSDRGIVMLRRLLQKQLEAVRQGGDPAGVSFDPEAPPVVFQAGNFLLDEMPS